MCRYVANTHATLCLKSQKAYSLLLSFYFREGFVHLESVVGEAIIRLMANPNMTDCDGDLHNITVSMKQLPYPHYTLDIFLITASSTLSLLIVLAFIYSAGTFTKVLYVVHVNNIHVCR